MSKQKNTTEITKAYEPKDVEDRLYQEWEKAGVFKPSFVRPGRTSEGLRPNQASNNNPFSIAMPPPNATGVLHIGHATFVTLQDIMTRHARMQGRPTLWLPGTDHAAIATETRVEKILIQETGQTKQAIGREEFLKKVNQYVAGTQSAIKKQIRKMGASCDWSRERYTLDPGLSRAVAEVFIKMHNDGLIYRGHRIVNWCPGCQSTIADDEVEHEENNAALYTFTYDKNFPIPIATVRPETKLGDTAVAVNPKDSRYKKYVGKTFAVDFLGNPLSIKVIADKSIDPNFGTGALGVTPAHSMADAMLAEKHKLKSIPVIGEDGQIKPGFGQYSGLPVLEARLSIAEDLKKKNLLAKQEEIINQLSVCYRCGQAVEPLISEQWFVNVAKAARTWPPSVRRGRTTGGKQGKKRSLKEITIDTVKSGDIDIIPARFKKTYSHWLENLHDWCISRQLYFGHRIPVWYCEKNRGCEPAIAIEKPKKCAHCQGKSFKQDPDTLDTWFSSALWTFSTLLDAPKKNDTIDSWIKRNKQPGKDLARFHPTSVLETAYEILFFWVARMILMTTYVVGEIPFKTVYLHGLVRDKLGRKMSKSLDNGIDPLDMIEKYGTDAVRLSLVIGATPGNDTRMYEEKIAGCRNFVNKIWNIARFVLTRHPEAKPKDLGVKPLDPSTSARVRASAQGDVLTLADRWIESRLNNLIKEVDKHYEKYEFSLAGEKIYDFLWHELADWYIEISKQQDHTLAPKILLEAIKLLHPFTPFVTEEIFQLLKQKKLVDAKDKFLALAAWPKAGKSDKKAEADLAALQELVTVIRDLRAKHNLPYADKLDAAVATVKYKKLFQNQELAVEQLTKVRIQVVPTKPVDKNEYIRAHTDKFDVYIKLSGQDIAAQLKRLAKEKTGLTQYAAALEKKLANKAFVENAPALVVEKEKQKLAEAKAKLEKL